MPPVGEKNVLLITRYTHFYRTACVEMCNDTHIVPVMSGKVLLFPRMTLEAFDFHGNIFSSK